MEILLNVGHSANGHLSHRQFGISATGVITNFKPGCVGQSVGHLTRKSEVLGSIPGLATYFRFSFLIQEGQLSVTDESMCTKYWLTA